MNIFPVVVLDEVNIYKKIFFLLFVMFRLLLTYVYTHSSKKKFFLNIKSYDFVRTTNVFVKVLRCRWTESSKGII